MKYPSCYYYDRYDGKNVKKYSMPSGQICRIILCKCSKAADKYAAGSLWERWWYMGQKRVSNRLTNNMTDDDGRKQKNIKSV